MKSINFYLSAIVLLLAIACNTPTKTSVEVPKTTQSTTQTPPIIQLPQLGKNTNRDVIKAMTLEEKANICIGMGFFIPGMPDSMFPPIDSVDKNTPEKVVGAAGRTHAIPRLGIPSITVSDGPAGVRIQPIRGNDPSKTYYATAFPIGTALASTWDTALVASVGVAFGSEVREYGIDVLLGPAMNIHRNSLGGRNFEYYSEDPLVSGNMAAAIVNGVQSNGVGTSVKHFAANNNEFNRMAMNTHVSERALREIYLKNFQITLKNSNPWTFMSSYNLINGTYTSQSRALLDTILRKEYGFKGMIMTDWFGGKDAFEQMKAGNDLMMPGNLPQKNAIINGVKANPLMEKILDENVGRILDLVVKSPTYLGYKYSDKPDLISNAKVSRKAATEGMILLKNEAVLPLATTKKVALFGNTSYDLIAGGTGSGDVNKAYMISLNEGLTNAKYTIDAGLMDIYKTYKTEEKAKQPKPRTPFDPKVSIAEMPIGADVLANTVGRNDVAIITIGKNSGEFADRNLAIDFNLTSAEIALIDEVSGIYHAKKKKVIVVLNIGGVIETASWRDKVDGILLAWQSGQETGNAIADVLSGAVNPSGKLPTTFPINYKDEASSANFPGKELPSTDNKPRGMIDSKPSEITYEEGIYVGYRYFNTYNVKTAYPFGFGLSYTDFTYSNLKLSQTEFKDKLTATITVTNAGKTAGKEVVQMYLRAPDKKLNKPDSELKAFAKTTVLQPKESQTLTFTINAIDLASFNTASSSWIAEAGNYVVKIGSSSTDIKQQAPFSLAKELEVEKVRKVLVPQTAIKEMRSRTGQ
jgi:beta-glucosidase